MNIQQQSATYLHQIANRNRRPVRGTTLNAYRSFIDTWIVPEIGTLELEQVENGVMRGLVAKMASDGKSASTIAGVTNCVKGILGSAVDGNGNELFPRKWNSDFIDAPVLDPRQQNAPVIARNQLETAISEAHGAFKPLYALLAGSGLRKGEALSLRRGLDNGKDSLWLPAESKLVIRGQVQNGQFLPPKTDAGRREVDLAPELNQFLLDTVRVKSSNYIFGSIDERQAYTVSRGAEIPGFHSFRRFRITHLENSNVPRGLQLFWTGHAGRDVHDRYVKIGEDIAARRTWAEKIGLGFNLGE